NFKLQHLLLLAPVDDEAQLQEIETRELSDIENNLGVHPAGNLTSDARNWAPLNDRRGDQCRSPHLLAKFIDAVRPGVGGIGDGYQTDWAGKKFSPIFGLDRGDPEPRIRD